MSEYIVDSAVPNHTVRVEDEREVYWHMTYLPVREEIVRCRDCKHAQVRHPLNPITGVPVGIEDWRCDYFWNADELPEVEPDGFCAWGERRESE